MSREPSPTLASKPEDGKPAEAPAIATVAPRSAVVGAPAPTLIVTGTGFAERSFVELEFVPLPTAFISATELRASVPQDLLATVGTRRVTVSTAPPGGGTSAPFKLETENPKPKLTSLAPTSALVNAQPITMTVTGSGFVSGAKLTLGGEELLAKVESATTISATVPAAKLASSGLLPVTVVNPSPGGGKSTPLSFTVASSNVSITRVTPASAVLGAGPVTLALTGTGFAAGSSVSLNGVALPTTFVSTTRLTIAVPAQSLTTPGSFSIVVTNPAPGGGVSVPASFQVLNPAPTVDAVAPNRVTVGAAPTPVVVTGRGFTSESRVRFAAIPQATTFVSASELRATIDAARLTSAGVIEVDVNTPTPGGGTGGPVTFTVDNPRPTIGSTAPVALVAGGTDATLTVHGSGFVRASVVTLDGADIATTFVDPTQLRVTVPAARLTQGSVSVAVRSPAPGGGTSAPHAVAIGAPSSTEACDTRGSDVVLAQLRRPATVPLEYTHAPAPRFRYSSTDPSFTTCPLAEIGPSMQPYATRVVQNGTNDLVYLSAWATCQPGDDAFLAVYEGAAAAPATDDARKACTGRVANGTSSAGGFASPESNGSIGCPGLTKANLGTVVLLPCEKAVVLVQPFGYPTYGRPATLKVQIED